MGINHSSYIVHLLFKFLDRNSIIPDIIKGGDFQMSSWWHVPLATMQCLLLTTCSNAQNDSLKMLFLHLLNKSELDHLLS